MHLAVPEKESLALVTPAAPANPDTSNPDTSNPDITSPDATTSGTRTKAEKKETGESR